MNDRKGIDASIAVLQIRNIFHPDPDPRIRTVSRLCQSNPTQRSAIVNPNSFLLHYITERFFSSSPIKSNDGVWSVFRIHIRLIRFRIQIRIQQKISIRIRILVPDLGSRIQTLSK